MKNLFVLFCLSFHTSLFSQSLVDSVAARFHIERFLSNSYHHILGLSYKNVHLRLRIDDKNHNIVLQFANSRFTSTHYLDSVCHYEHYPINCIYEDSIKSNYPNREKLDWGNSIQIFNFKLKKQRIDRKDLLKKWFGNLDSIVSCREVFINDDKKPDLAILRKVRGDSIAIDSITHETAVIPTNKIDLKFEILINRDTCYSIISGETFTQLNYLYLANFKVINGRFLYFYIRDKDTYDTNSLWISEQLTD